MNEISTVNVRERERGKETGNKQIEIPHTHIHAVIVG